MLSRLMLFKMLYGKSHRKREPRNSERGKSKPKEYLDIVSVKQEVKTEDVSSICRVCLKFGAISIFGDSEDLSDVLALVCGIEVDINDKYPKHLCEFCHAVLQSAILLRKTAQQSNEMLGQQSFEYTVNEDIISHEEEEKSKSKFSYQCKKCNLNFDDFKEYSDHTLLQEHENMRLTCPICKTSYTKAYYKTHLSLHKLETPYTCDICGNKFATRGQLTKHKYTHFNYFPYKCSLCPYRGRFSEYLKVHMRSHTGEKPYKCTQCPFRSVNKSNLNKHMLTHKEDHDYKCMSCDRAFYTKRKLDLHFKVDHTGVKDHVCSICGKAFGYRKHLMRHQLDVHKREKLKNGRTPLYLQLHNKQIVEQ